MRNHSISIAAAAAVVLLLSSASFAANVDAATTPAAPATAPSTMAAPAPATTAETPAAPTATVAVKDPKKVVCKRLAPETGTRLGSRMSCMTNAQWDEITRQAQEGMKYAVQKGATQPDRAN